MFKMYKKWISVILKKPMNIFWILFFPLILTTLFRLTMGSEGAISSFDEKVKLGYIKGDVDVIEENMSPMFESEELKNYYEISFPENEEEAKNKVNDKEIDGYIFFTANDDFTYTLNVRTGFSSFSNSMIKNLAGSIAQNINETYSQLIKFSGEENIKQIDFTKNGDKIYYADKIPSMSAMYTYPAIVYSILFVGLLVQFVIRSISANMSYTGMRVELATVKKSKILISALLAVLSVGFVALVLLTIYIQFVLNIDLGLSSRFGYLLLVYIVGLIASCGFSAMLVLIASKKPRETQESILTSFLMAMYFLAGGMVNGIPIIVKKSVPILHYINPGVLLSDSIGYLSYKDDLSLFWTNMICVVALGVAFIGVAIILLRRKKNELY